MTAVERSDQELIEAFRRGDHEAFEILYSRYRRPLYHYLNQMMPGQTTMVDDLFQNTWIKAIDNLGKYQHRHSFFAWLVRIGHNMAVDHFRQASQRETVEVTEEQLASSRGIPWREIGTRELGKAIQGAIEQLPVEQKEVFMLRQNNVAFIEIAQLQNCSLNTALGRMHYAVNKLRQILQDWK